MRGRIQHIRQRVSLILKMLSVLVLLAGAGDVLAARDLSRREFRQELRFAADMAERGLWREAMFRWKRLLEQRPDEPRLLNNLAVAHEAIGEHEQAIALYARALELTSERNIATNHQLALQILEQRSNDEREDVEGEFDP
ncbi:MAG: tetratricopeptide repeat protein [Acidobacteriota bacterium]|nr:MAG: tetratricopeptide repeat protein [Acidobacteriota bacterium]